MGLDGLVAADQFCDKEGSNRGKAGKKARRRDTPTKGVTWEQKSLVSSQSSI